MNTSTHSKIGQYGAPFLHYGTLKDTPVYNPLMLNGIFKNNRRYCKILRHNINSTNYCKPDKCYYTDINDLKTNPPGWMKRGVRALDHAEYSVHNNISGGDTQYFGGDYNRLKYSQYTPFQHDPTWDDSMRDRMMKKFPNACKSFHHHRFV
jgi:hypothetical protein